LQYRHKAIWFRHDVWHGTVVS